MSSQGYEILRHRGVFYTRYLHPHMHVVVHGLEILRSIPCNPVHYARWLTEGRRRMDALADEVKIRDGTPMHPSFSEISSMRPFDDSVEHVYEIDYDTETFCYGGFPMFRLDCMPTESVYVSSLHFDSFNHSIPSESVPAEHLYRISQPLPPSEDDIHFYDIHRNPAGEYKALKDTLKRYSTLSDARDVRIRLYEIIAGAFMRNKPLHSNMCCSMLASSDNGGTNATVPAFVEEAALKLLLVAFLPMHFGVNSISIDARYDEAKRYSESGYLWIYHTLCAKAAMHLEDEDSLRGSIGSLARHIRSTNKQGVVYGVLCSLWQVVVVRVDMSREGEGSVEHTPALDFLPPRRVKEPWTSGLTTLMQLSFHLEHSIFDLGDPRAPSPPPISYPQTLLDRLPTELLAHTCSYLPSLLLSRESLMAFGELNGRLRPIVAPIVFRPSVEHCSLRSIVNNTSEVTSKRWQRFDERFTEDRTIPRSTFGRPTGILIGSERGGGGNVCVFEIKGVGALKLRGIRASPAVLVEGT
ncbi:hypothetical protein AB1N83_010268 [Pleurotus pulmonarius]